MTKASTALSQVWLGDTSAPLNGSNTSLRRRGDRARRHVRRGRPRPERRAAHGQETRHNAVVFRGITASAPTPTVYIGENNQATGLVTLTEQAAGFFQSGTGSNNVLTVCPAGVNYSFTFAPWAKVTAGDLKLREGVSCPPTTSSRAPPTGSPCYNWTVWTASTAASTIVIGDSTFTTGPLINVDRDRRPRAPWSCRSTTGDGGTITDARSPMSASPSPRTATRWP